MSTSTPKSPTPVQELFRVVFPDPESPVLTDGQADKAVKNFLADLMGLEPKHAPKPLSDEYLAGQAFLRSRAFKKDVERMACGLHRLNGNGTSGAALPFSVVTPHVLIDRVGSSVTR